MTFKLKFVDLIVTKYFFIDFHLRALDTLCRFSAIVYKGDNICDFIFAFLRAKSRL